LPHLAVATYDVMVFQLVELLPQSAPPIQFQQVWVKNKLAEVYQTVGNKPRPQQDENDGEDLTRLIEWSHFLKAHRGKGNDGHVESFKKSVVLQQDVSRNPEDQQHKKHETQHTDSAQRISKPGIGHHNAATP